MWQPGGTVTSLRRKSWQWELNTGKAATHRRPAGGRTEPEGCRLTANPPQPPSRRPAPRAAHCPYLRAPSPSQELDHLLHEMPLSAGGPRWRRGGRGRGRRGGGLGCGPGVAACWGGWGPGHPEGAKAAGRRDQEVGGSLWDGDRHVRSRGKRRGRESRPRWLRGAPGEGEARRSPNLAAPLPRVPPYLGTSPGASVCKVCRPCWICSRACMARGLVRTDRDSGFCIWWETGTGRPWEVA